MVRSHSAKYLNDEDTWCIGIRSEASIIIVVARRAELSLASFGESINQAPLLLMFMVGTTHRALSGGR